MTYPVLLLILAILPETRYLDFLQVTMVLRCFDSDI